MLLDAVACKAQIPFDAAYVSPSPDAKGISPLDTTRHSSIQMHSRCEQGLERNDRLHSQGYDVWTEG